MDAVEQRLMALETEVRKLRRRIHNEEANSGLTLESAIQVQSLPGELTKDVFFGYEGPIYKDVASDFDGLSTATDPYTRITSTVDNTNRDAILKLIAAEPDGALVQEYAEVDVVRDSGTGNLVRLIAANSSDVGVYRFKPNGTATVEVDGGGENDIITELHTDWVDLTDGGATTLHSHAISGYTRVYYKDNNGTSGRGPAVTTDETSLGSFTVTGNDMGTTGILRVRLMGISNGVGATRTVRIRVKFGGVTIYDDTSSTYATILPWFSEIHVANIGDAAVQRTGGFILIGAPTATTGDGDLATDEITATTPIYATSTIDTTADRTFEVTAQLSDGTSPNSFVCLSMVAELL